MHCFVSPVASLTAVPSETREITKDTHTHKHRVYTGVLLLKLICHAADIGHLNVTDVSSYFIN